MEKDQRAMTTTTNRGLTAVLLATAIMALPPPIHAGPVQPILKGLMHYADDAARAAIRVSSRELDDVARAALKRTVARAATRYGDDAFKAVRYGGVELIEAAAKHGDDVWEWSCRVPRAARSLALHADDLVPLTRKMGLNVLRLEATSSGLTRQLAARYGDDMVRTFVRTVDPGDAGRVAGYMAKADTPTTRRLLLKRYDATNGRIVRWLDWKTAMAFGLTAAVVTSAHEVSDGIQEGLKTVAREQPEVLGGVVGNAVSRIMEPIGWLGKGAVICLVLAVCLGLHVPSRLVREARRGRAGWSGEEAVPPPGT